MVNNIDKTKKGLIKNGRTNPVFDYSECIFEKVFVETPVDADGDGKLDLIAVLITRPKETLSGLKIPAIYVASPYVRECNEDWYIPHDVNVPLKAYETQNISEEDVSFDFSKEIGVTPKYPRETKGYAETAISEHPTTEGVNDVYSYFLSRGYARIYCGGLGTRESEGFTISGSREEILAFKSVVDWLNGKVRAFTDKESNIEIKANWCTGNVAMSGKSYLGTMCIGVATTGVEGLKTIIPEAGISNWYNYYRKNGLVAPAIEWQGDDIDILSGYCFSRAKDAEDYKNVKDAYREVLNNQVIAEDRDSGNYNKFWDERNYLKQVNNMRATALIIHGINDLNVMMNQSVPFWQELKKNKIASKMLLHQGNHIYVYNHENSKILDTMHKWLDYHLYEIDNGVIDEVPDVFVQNNLDQGLWQESEEFPPIGTKKYKFPINKDGVKEFVDDIEHTAFKLDDQKSDVKGNLMWRDELILPAGEEKSHEIKFVVDPKFEGKTKRISGTIEVSFDATLDKETGILSAMLVDYGLDKRITLKEEVVEEKGLVWGKNTPAADIVKFEYEENPSEYKIISRGWINAQNINNNYSKVSLIQGEYNTYSFDMIPTDYTFKCNHKLGLIIYGTDPEETVRKTVKTKVKVKLNTIVVNIPIVQ